MNCVGNKESDLVSTDLEQPSVTQHTLDRYASSSADASSLYDYIRQSHGINLRDPTCLPRVLRPLDQKDLIDEDSSLSNLDTEDGVLVHVDFSEMLRVKHILLSVPSAGEERPQLCRVWANRPNGLDLDQVEDVKPDQEFQVVQERGAQEYATRLSRFSNVSSLTIHLSLGPRSDSLRCYYIGFKGSSRMYKRDDSQPMMQGAETGVHAKIDGIKQSQGVAQSLAR